MRRRQFRHASCPENDVAITSCVLNESRGIAIESVDAPHIEDVTITNITMRDVANDPS
jgi:hypothetical protein